MPTLAELLNTPGTPANRVRTTLADLLRGYNREAVAGLVGAPVDMANTVSNLARAGIGYAGHKLGMLAQPPDLISEPVGGSDWIYNRLPAQPALTGSGAETAGRVLGSVVSPPMLMAGAPRAARTLASMLQEKVPAMADNYMDAMGMAPKATVWHGSPHQFDRFDSSKIGTGEGAQAYGHGLYLADTPGVASSYKGANASGGRPIAQLDGVPIANIKDKSGVVDWIDSYGSIANTRAALAGRKPELAAELDALVKSGRLTEGHLYKVDLPDNLISRMLDWDAPLSGQAGLVDVVRGARPGYMTAGMPNSAVKSADAYMALAEKVGDSEAAKIMRRAGIPGIRYLDGGSRGAGTGTRNYVVFPGEESALTILERNGKPIR